MLLAGKALQPQAKLIVTFFALVFHEKYSEKMKLYEDVLELVMISQ